MKVAILGATGLSGRQLVTQSLDRGYRVVAAVRNPEAVRSCLGDREDLEVKKVDLQSQQDLEAAFDGCDAVLCALGARPSFRRIDLMTDAVPRIVAAMRRVSTKRLLLITAVCTEYKPEHPWFLEWVFKPLVIGRNLDDFHRAEQYLLTECDDIDFTVVKPPRLTDGQLLDKELLVREGQFVPNAAGAGVPRANVAKFMLDCLQSGDWSRKLVAIQY